MPKPLHFKVPVGQEQHRGLVIGATLAVTVLGTLTLCVVILTVNRHDKKD